MSPKIIEQLAPKGVLRVAINLSNFLLVTDRSAEGNPAGVSPDMAAEVARRLGVGIEYVEYKTPGEIADDAGKDAWDIANIGADMFRVVYSGKVIFFNATNPKKGKGRNIMDLKIGIK